MTSTDQPLGEIERTDSGWILRFERRLAHPPAKVWRALTESEHLRHWLPVDMTGERRAGATIVLTFWPEVVDRHDIATPALPGEIRVWDPPRVFEWTWDTDVLRFELAPADGGCVLTLTTWAGPEPHAVLVGAGYHACLACLGALLDTGEPMALMEVDTAALEARYRAVVGD